MTHTTYTSTPEVTELPTTIANLQYTRYIERRGRRPQGPHVSDYPYSSPQHHNMRTGQSYRTWFHSEISHNYHTLGAAMNMYYDWLSDTSPHPAPALTDHHPKGQRDSPTMISTPHGQTTPHGTTEQEHKPPTSTIHINPAQQPPPEQDRLRGRKRHQRGQRQRPAQCPQHLCSNGA